MWEKGKDAYTREVANTRLAGVCCRLYHACYAYVACRMRKFFEQHPTNPTTAATGAIATTYSTGGSKPLDNKAVLALHLDRIRFLKINFLLNEFPLEKAPGTLRCKKERPVFATFEHHLYQ